MLNIQYIANELKQAKKIVVLTGAGISTESGIPDFRSSEGLWTYDRKREEILSIQYFHKNPKHFWKVFKEVFQVKLSEQIEPNYGHKFLVELERMGKQVIIFTQNVDGLHTKAGSSQVFELHGTTKKAICPACMKRKQRYANADLQYEYDLAYIQNYDIPRCQKCNTILKPDVVLFGENIKNYKEAFSLPLLADVMLVLGSSLEVSPVNLIPSHFKNDLYKETPDAEMFLINKEPTALDYLFDVVIHDKIGNTLLKIKEVMEG